MYAKPLVIADAFKLKISKDILVVEPYNVTYSDSIGICCPLQQVLKVQSFNVNKFFIRDIIKDMISMAIDKSATSKIEACANILVNLSSSSIIYEPGMNILDEKLRKYYDEQIHVSEGEVIKICVETVSQSESTVWFDTRKKRISASSKAHAIKARKRKEITKLISEFLSSENKQGIRSLEYGLKYEKIALDEYISQTQSVVHCVGVFIMPQQPWICVSPDGVVIENDCITKIVEIKCPSSCQSKPVYDMATKSFNVPYLDLENDIVTLQPSHQYYTQCQMLMYATGLTECDLFVWSPKGSCLTSIHRDDTFLKNLIHKLKEFYFSHYLPVLQNISSEANETNVTD